MFEVLLGFIRRIRRRRRGCRYSSAQLLLVVEYDGHVFLNGDIIFALARLLNFDDGCVRCCFNSIKKRKHR